MQAAGNAVSIPVDERLVVRLGPCKLLFECRHSLSSRLNLFVNVIFGGPSGGARWIRQSLSSLER